MQPTIVPGVSLWSRRQPDRALYFNSWLVTGPEGAFVVDPLEPHAEDLAVLDAAGLQAVILTNRDHERAAALFVERYRIPVIASLPDAGEIVVRVDRTVNDGEWLFGWQTIALEGFKTAGEFVLFHPPSLSAIAGDAFWGAPAGDLRFMPDDKLRDPALAARSAGKLLATGVKHILVGDGMPVFHRASDAIRALLDAR